MDPDKKLTELMKVLSHKIRTPLSIIQNELSCIKGKIEEEEYQRILGATRSINEILKEKPEVLLNLIGGKDE